jgi:tRNA1Val (adenine37-N6)-methyltransferase
LGLNLTEGHLLGGAIHYAQPEAGYRTGIEPVFLAAAVPARGAERVLEAGTGAGAGLLCLSHRVPGISGVGIEIEGEMAAIADANFARNERPNLAIRHTDLLSLSATEGPFDHAMANPPWHDPAGTTPDGALRRRAKVAAAGLVGLWTKTMADLLRPRGTLTLALPPRAVPEALATLASCGCGAALLFPLWPKRGREAKILLLQAAKGSRAEFRLLPGLILHEDDGRYTEAADAILRRGEALPIG